MCKKRSLQSDFTDGIIVLYKRKGIVEGCHDSQISHRTKAAGKESTSQVQSRWTRAQSGKEASDFDYQFTAVKSNELNERLRDS